MQDSKDVHRLIREEIQVRGEFRKISAIELLRIICTETERYESVLTKVLPEIFAELDEDADGWLDEAEMENGAKVLVG